MELWDHQERALAKLKNGSILVGGTGSGKSLTALSYYLKEGSPAPLYIITTAKKRNEGDWLREAEKLNIEEPVVDSWHNIKKYVNVKDSFFIFDEQKVIGKGVWVRSFLKITKFNKWILLSATPADTWMDLIPVFIANGFYKNRTHFIREHVVYAPYVTYPKILRYLNESKLKKLRDLVFVVMSSKKHTKSHTTRLMCDYNEFLLKETIRKQWNPFEDKPIKNLGEETYIARKIINSSPSRIFKLWGIHNHAKKLIVFYNFTFELELMKFWFKDKTFVAEYNGFRHDPLPEGDDWLYIVQYHSGSEAWECFTTNHMAFYSLNYSYRQMHQSRGRIDRHNTHYVDLYYYELVSDSYVDLSIQEAFNKKQDFNLEMLMARRSQLL